MASVSESGEADHPSAHSAVNEDPAQRMSLLDVVVDEYNQERDARTSRLVLIGEVDSEKVSALQKFHTDFLDALDISGVRLTGVLVILNSQAFVAIVEAPSKVLVRLMKNLTKVSSQTGEAEKKSSQQQQQSSAVRPPGWVGTDPTLPNDSSDFISVDARFYPLVRSIRILSFNEEVPREFHIWATRLVRVAVDEEYAAAYQMAAGNSHSEGGQASAAATSINWERDGLRICFETVRGFLELARDISGLSEERAIEYVTSNHSKQFLAKLPPTEKILAIIHAYSEHLCSIDEWMELFDTPVDITLESEKVWPVEPFLKY